MIFGDSGHGKTNIINAAFAPLEQVEKRLYAEYKNAPICILKNSIDQPPPPPEPRRFLAMDVTIEKVGEMLSKQDSVLYSRSTKLRAGSAEWIATAAKGQRPGRIGCNRSTAVISASTA
jgi:hypothetical protein